MNMDKNAFIQFGQDFKEKKINIAINFRNMRWIDEEND